MQLSDQAIEEFKRIYSEEYEHQLSDEEAQEIALRFLNVVEIISERPQG